MLAIATLAEMKAELGLKDHEDDMVLTRWMEGLQSRFDTHLNRTLARGAGVTELFDGGVTFIRVARWPIESVASVYVDADQDWADAGNALASTDYRYRADRGLIYYSTNAIEANVKWPAGIQNIRVVYTGGYAAGSYPDDLRRVFFIQLGFEWRNRLNLGKQSVSAQGANISIAPAKFLPEVLAGLSAHQNL